MREARRSKKTKTKVNTKRVDYTESARDRIVNSRNVLREEALKYDYFLSLEIDLEIQPDTITKLLSHNKEIISAYYGNDTALTLKSKKTSS